MLRHAAKINRIKGQLSEIRPSEHKKRTSLQDPEGNTTIAAFFGAEHNWKFSPPQNIWRCGQVRKPYQIMEPLKAFTTLSISLGGSGPVYWFSWWRTSTQLSCSTSSSTKLRMEHPYTVGRSSNVKHSRTGGFWQTITKRQDTQCKTRVTYVARNLPIRSISKNDIKQTANHPS